MAMWKVEPTWKKSLSEIQYWSKDGKTITYEEGWRWGTFYYSTEGDEPPVIEEGDDLFCVDDAELVDWSTDDGCWCDYSFDNMSEEEQEQLNEFFEENSVYDLEEQGWYMSDSEMIVSCEVEITKDEDE